MQTEQDFFAPPPEGAVATAAVEFLRVDYSALKTPESYARQATPEVQEQNIAAQKLGFHYYDKDATTRRSIHPLSFVILEVYSAISGSVQLPGGDWIQYWSNRVKDTRVEPFSIWDGGKKPILSGIYSQIKEGMPSGAKFHIHLIAYCMQLDRLVEIKLTAGVSRSIQRAIAAAEQAAGRNRKWEKVSLFGLADNDHLWGFKFTGFLQEDKDGNPYKNKGDLYFAPSFACGVVQPVGQMAELHAKCVDLQSQVRAQYAANAARFAKPAETAAATESAPAVSKPVDHFPPVEGPINTNVQPNHDAKPEDDLPF